VPPQTRLARLIHDVRRDLDRVRHLAAPAPADLQAARALLAEVPDALDVARAAGDLRRVALPFFHETDLDVRRALVAFVLTHDPALADALRRRGFKVT
jgi:uncharacterized protein (DUF2461 family)